MSLTKPFHNKITEGFILILLILILTLSKKLEESVPPHPLCELQHEGSKSSRCLVSSVCLLSGVEVWRSTSPADTPRLRELHLPWSFSRLQLCFSGFHMGSGGCCETPAPDRIAPHFLQAHPQQELPPAGWKTVISPQSKVRFTRQVRRGRRVWDNDRDPSLVWLLSFKLRLLC